MPSHLLTEILGVSNVASASIGAAKELISKKITHLTKSLVMKYTITIPPTHYPTQNFVLNPFLTSAGSDY
jgi:hypothetical protein